MDESSPPVGNRSAASGAAKPDPRSAVRHRLPRFVSIPECTMPAGVVRCVCNECRYHLAQGQTADARLEPARDCAISVANEGPHTTEEIARIAGMTRARVRQLEASALEKLARCSELRRVYDEYK